MNIVPSETDSDASPVQTAVRGIEALKVTTMSPRTPISKEVAVVTDEQTGRTFDANHEPVVDLDEDIVGSKNHLLG
jgi:hypothetical protein